MRNFVVLILLALASFNAGPSFAKQSVRHHHTDHQSDNSYYTNVNGHRVHRPVRSSNRPGGATARCADGTWSFSENRRGTCSHHGGVARWL